MQKMKNFGLAPLSDGSKEILFVFGAARSGTTYLNKIVDDWFGFGMGPEGHFLEEYAARAVKVGELADDELRTRFIEDIAGCGMLEIIRSKWQHDLRFDVTAKDIETALEEKSYAGIVYAIFKCVAARQSKSRVGNKNPGYWQCLPLLHELFPTQAKYLNIIRDGRDVALSTVRIQWGQKNIYSCAKHWAAAAALTASFADSVPRDRILTIRYEDLLSEPENTFRVLGNFLNVKCSAELVDSFLADFELGAKKTNFYKWKSELKADDVRIFESVAGQWLKKFDYETVYEEPKSVLSERALYNALELGRKIKVNLKHHLVK